MLHASHHPFLRRVQLLAPLVTIGAWLFVATPAMAQSEATPPPSMIEQFFKQPNLAAPLVVPMILALGGIIVLMFFLGWVVGRLPDQGR